MKITWRTEWPLWLLLMGLFALAASSWAGAPDRIAVHWGLAGHPDRWGGKFEGLLLMPLVGLGIYLLMLLLPRIDPGRANYSSFVSPYFVLRLVVLLVLAVLQVCVVLTMRGYPVEMGTVVPLILGATFVVLGNLFGKLRPTWFVGIRTPWTLSSKESWSRTHRAGGWLFIALGLLLMTSALVHSRWFLWTTVVLMGAGILALFAYSYWVWKADPDKVPPAGTTPAEP